MSRDISPLCPATTHHPPHRVLTQTRSRVVGTPGRRGGRAQSNPGGRSCAHGRSASICAASAISVASSFGLPTSCTARGSPSRGEPRGHRARGLAGEVPARRVRHGRGGHGRRPQPAVALARADLRRGRWGHRRQQHVVVGQRLVQARGVRLPASQRPVERARRQHPPEARQRADSPFQALGMRERGGLLVQAAQVDGRELGRRRQRAMIDLALVHLVSE